LSGADLEIYAENEGLKKGAAIASLANQREVILTNPDIFHYLHRGAYIIYGDSPDKLWNRIDKDFDLFIFDEFHVFATPQIASVINTMLLIHCTNRRKKFLFLSATPDRDLISKLEVAGFRCQEINPLE
jgi:CRISPR-associated endonuclease/helicase Cas3